MAKAGLRRSGALRSYSEATGVSFLGFQEGRKRRRGALGLGMAWDSRHSARVGPLQLTDCLTWHRFDWAGLDSIVD